MEYTVDKLARLAGVSPRTLRHYDQIGLLPPARISPAGYRIYGAAEVDKLQQILFYRELGMALPQIAETLQSGDFNRMAALCAHRDALKAEKTRLERLLTTLEKTIQAETEGISMTDNEKFEGFKAKLLQENEQKYGAELREKYGEAEIAGSNAKMMNLTPEEYARMEALGAEIFSRLESAVRADENPAGGAGEAIARLHKEWLGYTWAAYSAAAHRGLADMYLADERFTVYYDKNVPGCTRFLRDAIYGAASL